jgi:hypothetical protein
VLRFNARGPEALATRKAPGQTPIQTGDLRAALAAAVEAGPRPYLDGVVRWRLVDLALWAHEELGVSVIPSLIDQNPFVQARRPIDEIRHG